MRDHLPVFDVRALPPGAGACQVRGAEAVVASASSVGSLVKRDGAVAQNGGEVVIDCLIDVPVKGNFSVSEADASGAEVADHVELVTDEEDCPPGGGDVFHFADAALLEVGVTNGEDFVDDEDFGLEVGSDGEGEADIHA